MIFYDYLNREILLADGLVFIKNDEFGTYFQEAVVTDITEDEFVVLTPTNDIVRFQDGSKVVVAEG